MNRFNESMDRYITGNYGEDQFKNEREMDTKITLKQHIKKHTLKEDTHNFNCPYCEGLK